MGIVQPTTGALIFNEYDTCVIVQYPVSSAEGLK